MRSVEELEQLLPEWRALWLADYAATPFQSPEWLLPWWRAVGEGELVCLALRDAEKRLVGLLPTYVYTQPEGGRRDALLLGAGTSDYLDGLFAAHDQAKRSGLANELLRSALEVLRDESDCVILHQLRAQSALLEAGRKAEMQVGRAESCLEISTDVSLVPSKMRLNLGRYRRRAEREGALRFCMAQTPSEAAEAFERLVELHRRRWDARGETGVLSAPAVQRHHREAVPRLQEAGLLRMMMLWQDDVLLGVLYVLLDPECRGAARRCYSYLIGVEPSRAALSPGSLLLECALRSLAEEGVSTFDMLRGAEEYKRFWGAKESPTYSIAHP